MFLYLSLKNALSVHNISNQAAVYLDYLSFLFCCEKFRSKHREEVPFPQKSPISVCDSKRNFCLLGIFQTPIQLGVYICVTIEYDKSEIQCGIIAP